MARETINEREGKNNCSKHSKEVAGISDMKVLAEMIGDLHYETLTELLSCLSEKFDKDAEKDFKNGKNELANSLTRAALNIGDAWGDIRKAWQISKPFMEGNQKQIN